MSSDPDENRKKFESLGEQKVRDYIARRTFKPDRIRQAEQWLAQRTQERLDQAELRKTSSDNEANQIAQAANEIAKEANKSATTANWIAWAAFVCVIISIGISIYKNSN